jgi:nicotinamidase-related amidase
MTTPFSTDPVRTAVLSMDCQAGIVSIYVKDEEGFLKQPASALQYASTFLGRAAGVLQHARALGMTVIHVQIAFRPKLPEVSTRNLLLAAIKKSPRHQQLFEGAAGAIHPALGPQGDDIVVTKHRVNAFAGTDLDLILRARNIETLVLFGIATSGVVLSTLLHAADADYRLVVIQDCCADLDADLHAALVGKLFPRQATVLSAADFVAAR